MLLVLSSHLRSTKTIRSNLSSNKSETRFQVSVMFILIPTDQVVSKPPKTSCP